MSKGSAPPGGDHFLHRVTRRVSRIVETREGASPLLYRFKARFQKFAALAGTSGLTANDATLGGWLCVAAYAFALYGGLAIPGARAALWLVPPLALLRL